MVAMPFLCNRKNETVPWIMLVVLSPISKYNIYSLVVAFFCRQYHQTFKKNFWLHLCCLRIWRPHTCPWPCNIPWTWINLLIYDPNFCHSMQWCRCLFWLKTKHLIIKHFMVNTYCYISQHINHVDTINHCHLTNKVLLVKFIIYLKKSLH